MNEKILNAILNLLAIVASQDGISTEERQVITDFVEEHVRNDKVKPFIALIDAVSPAKSLEEAYQKAENICFALNGELNLPQKLIIVTRLTELAFADSRITIDEKSLIDKIASFLNIPTKLYISICGFVYAESANSYVDDYVLMVSAGQIHGSVCKQLIREDFPAKIAVLRLPDVEMFFIRIFEVIDNLTLNGELLRVGKVYPLAIGSVIRGEHVDAIYYSEIVGRFLSGANEEKVSFEADNICLTFRNGKQGLKDVNLKEHGGKLIALMGASGAGKSTLLNVLNGNIIPNSGTVKINGIDLYKQPEKLRGVIGYVPQDDLLIEDLSVYQNLYFAAKLCFASKSNNEIDTLVTQTLKSLGLYETRDLKVGSVLKKTISGGQRKRLNIGLELLRQPAVMFVDEPTSGLSSRDSENIMDLLRELSLLGKLIFVVIHQPSSEIFKMFDRLIILDRGGLPIYYGNPIDAVTYFKRLDLQLNQHESECPACGNVNPEQIFNIIEGKVIDEFGHITPERKSTAQYWHEVYLESIKIPNVVVESTPPFNALVIPNKIRQWVIFTTRDVIAKLHNTQYLAINLLQAPLLALLLAVIVRYDAVNELSQSEDYIFSDNMNVPSYIFIAIIVALFMGLTVSAEEIIKDAKILKREAFLHLSRSSYLASKIGIMFFFSLLQTGMFVLIGNYVIGIQDMGIMYWLVLFSVSCFANMLGLNISATFNSAITIYILIPLLLIPQLILGGIVVKFDEVNPRLAKQASVPILGEIMASRWAYEALMVHQFVNNKYNQPLYRLEKDIYNAKFKHSYYVPVLDTKVEACLQLIGKPDMNSNKFAANLTILRKATTDVSKSTNLGQFKDLDKITPVYFNAAVGNDLKGYLEKVGNFYLKFENQQFTNLDNLKRKLYPTTLGLLTAKHAFDNDRIKEIVEDNSLTGSDFVIETKGQLVRKYKPIYQDADLDVNPLNFRTHFYAPTKQFFGKLYATPLFNVGVIWALTFGLYMALYFRALRRLLGIKNLA